MCGIVQRSERTEIANAFDYFISDKAAVLEERATLHHSVTERGNLAEIVHDLAVAGGESFLDRVECLCVGWHGNFGHIGLAVDLVCELAAVHADSFAKTLCDDRLVVHINELIFERGTACIDNKNFHWYYLLS